MPTWIWLNIPLMVLAFALTVGIPVRMVLRDRARNLASPGAAADEARREHFDELIAA